jgi:hypothetical protein
VTESYALEVIHPFLSAMIARFDGLSIALHEELAILRR